ncbi:MAG: hypothetical protein V1702_01150 [Candidatus Woesearchaeota archaeon]
MKNKSILAGIWAFTLLVIICPVMAMNCYVNNQQIPCDVFWSNYGWFLAIPFTVIGLLFSIKTDWLIKAQIWYLKLFGSKWVPGKIIPKLLRAMGIFFLIVGLVFLYLTIVR